MSITVNIRYSGKGNAAVDFAKEMTENGTVENIRAEKGNLRYEYFVPLFDGNGNAGKTVLLIDQWENQEAIDELAAQALSGEGNMDAKEAEYWIKKAGYTEEMLKELDKLQEKSLDMFKKMQKENQ